MNVLNIYIFGAVVAVFVIILATIVVMIFAPNELNRDCALKHNYYRHLHSSPFLSVSKELIEYAEKRAEELRTTNKFAHPKNSPFGENLYKMTYSWDNSESLDNFECETAMKLWYNEIDNYDYERGSTKNGKMVGHFTQIVWTDTTEIGCAKSYSLASKTLYLVCNYSPSGNWVGYFIQKVPAQRVSPR